MKSGEIQSLKRELDSKDQLCYFATWLLDHTGLVSSCREFLWPPSVSGTKLKAHAKHKTMQGKDRLLQSVL